MTSERANFPSAIGEPRVSYVGYVSLERVCVNRQSGVDLGSVAMQIGNALRKHGKQCGKNTAGRYVDRCVIDESNNGPGAIIQESACRRDPNEPPERYFAASSARSAETVHTRLDMAPRAMVGSQPPETKRGSALSAAI